MDLIIDTLILRRINNIFQDLVTFSDNENIDMDRLLDLLFTHSTTKQVRNIGVQLWNIGSALVNRNMVPLVKALKK